MRKSTIRPHIDTELFESVRSMYPGFQGNESEFSRWLFQSVQAGVLSFGGIPAQSAMPQVVQSSDEYDEWLDANDET